MQLLSKIEYSFNYFQKKYLNFNKLNYPFVINFPITDNCNSKCQMCNVWVDKAENEITPDEITSTFKQDLFKNVQHIGISGGEPTLRDDLVECIKALLDSNKQLKTLSLTTHGFNNKKWEELLPKIVDLVKERGIQFGINMSVDGYRDGHEVVRRVKNAWDKINNSLRLFKQYNLPIQLQCTISKFNVYEVNQLLDFAIRQDVDMIFRVATSIERLYNNDITDEFFLNEEEYSFIADFLVSDNLMNFTKKPNRRLLYREIAKRIISDKKRKAPCYFQKDGLLLGSNGAISHCSIDINELGNIREKDAKSIYFSEKSHDYYDQLINDKCDDCIHDQNGFWNPFSLIREELRHKSPLYKKTSMYINFIYDNIKAYLPYTLSYDQPDSTIHITGAYGGEHVGDSAILGGVILRAKKRHPNFKKVIVYSTRYDRTKKWVNGLDFLNCIIEVQDLNTLKKIHLNKSDKLIWAGGPIMDIPTHNIKLYRLINTFVSNKLDFEIIGSALENLKSSYSKSLISRIVSKASYIQLRNKPDTDKDYLIDQDPAFDYYQNYLSNKTNHEYNSLNKIKTKKFFKALSNPEKKNVLINIRPLWDKFNHSKSNLKDIEENVIKQIFNLISSNQSKNYNFIFVPFNTDQFGFSDMNIGIKIQNFTDEHSLSNYFLFNRELNFREMDSLLDNIDMAICMRFHACIFMMSRKIPVFGIDYSVGINGKVKDLFKSKGIEPCTTISDISSKEMQEFLLNN